MKKDQDSIRLEMRALLKKHNLRVTSSRMAVMIAMYEKRAPMTHQELMLVLPKGFDKASTWRVLANLADVGLLVRMDLGDRVWRYELAATCSAITEQSSHAHFLCDDCGLVHCLPKVSLNMEEPLPAELEGAELHIRVTGRCRNCLPAQP